MDEGFFGLFFSLSLREAAHVSSLPTLFSQHSFKTQLGDSE